MRYSLKIFCILVKTLVAKADFLGILDIAAIINFFYIRPEDCPEAHRARLARCVQLAAGEVECSEVLAGVADCGYFAVAGRVASKNDLIVTAPDNFAVFCDYAAERSALAVFYAKFGFFYCNFHKLVHIFLLILRFAALRLFFYFTTFSDFFQPK